MDDNKRKEIIEAVNAGNIALDRLTEAEKFLSSASHWGVVDILGGGFFTSVIKHGKMDDAQNAINEARIAMDSFRKEVKDVNLATGTDISVGGLITCIDIFCDSFIADVYVQSRISEARSQVEMAINDVQHIIKTLKKKLSEKDG